ncbi:MAG TPA: hypothetical protein DCM38_07765 [Gammaproteobacteria bacterium]|nr:hypothetical protein [Gammaproteobacteria bacterium]
MNIVGEFVLAPFKLLWTKIVRKKKIPTQLKLIHDNITTLAVDAIVNAACFDRFCHGKTLQDTEILPRLFIFHY